MTQYVKQVPTPCAYVVPLRRWALSSLAEFAGYLEALPPDVEVIVVDGSAPNLFEHHARHFGARVRHVALPSAEVTPNGKVGGVCYGIGLAGHEHVVIADDDVRYSDEALGAVLGRLRGAEIVRPQNYFEPAPWHALWDTARTLLNRMTGGDWPGTLGVRRSAFLAAGGYAGDVLFENLELVRSIARRGGREDVARDIYVRRLPPDDGRFVEQRVRQAYDELARPARMALFLAVLPVSVVALGRGGWPLVAGAAAVLVAIAEAGRRREGGARYFSWTASWFAPLWLVERGACSWIALFRRCFGGGIAYGGSVLRRAAT